MPLVIAFTAATVLSRAAAAAPLIIHAGMSGHGTDEAQIVVSLTHPTEYRLSAPASDRIVIDLPAARLAAAPGPAPARGPAARLRAQGIGDGGTRLIVELSAPARVAEAYFMKATERKDYQLLVRIVPAPARTTAEPPLRTAKPTAPAVAPDPIGAARSPAAAGPTANAPPAAAVARLVPQIRPAPRPAGGHALGGAEPRPPDRVVVIDPGHGGKDPGAISPNGVMEKTITLAYAREIQQQLRARGGYKVVLTRQRDVFIPLAERVTRARKAGAELFLSIHADSMANPHVSGLSVYTVSERASDAEAAALADRENRVDRRAGITLKAQSPEAAVILIDVMQRQTINRAIDMASLLVTQLRETTPILPQRPHRFAGFVVLKAPDVPSVLVELGFLSNAADEARLQNIAHRRRVAAQIAGAVDAFFGQTLVANAR